MSIREQTQIRKRHTHHRRNAYHAPMTDATRVQLELHIAERTIDFICSGTPVDVDALPYEGARRRIRDMLTPFHLAIILKQRVMAGEKVDVWAILTQHPEAYSKWMRYLTPAEKERLGIRTWDDGTMKSRAQEREEARFAELRAFARVA